MPGSCSLGTTLCGTPAVVRPVLSCGPTYAFCSAVRFGTCVAAEWPMAKCSLLLLWWLWLLPGYDGLSGLTGFGCLLTLQGRR